MKIWFRDEFIFCGSLNLLRGHQGVIRERGGGKRDEDKSESESEFLEQESVG